MSTDARLGFAIDSGPLVQGSMAAEKFAMSLYKVADAQEKTTQASRKAQQNQVTETHTTDRATKAADTKTKVQQALRQALDASGKSALGMSGYMQGLSGSMDRAGALMHSPQGVLAGMNGMVASSARLLPLLGGTAGAVAGLTVGIGALAVAAGGLLVVTSRSQEQYALLEARLKNVYGSATIAESVFKDLTRVAQENGQAVALTADSYLRLARNNEAIGLSRAKMLELTDAVQKLGAVSGASNAELAGGLLQFSQALAAGRLNGDELRSIMENMPALAKAIADGLGVSVGQLRAMGAAGELSSQKIVAALLSEIPNIQKEFEGLPETTEKAFTRVANNWDRMLASMGERLNASGIITGVVNAGAEVLGLAADAVAIETPEQMRDRLTAEYNRYLDVLGDDGASNRAQSEARIMSEQIRKQLQDLTPIILEGLSVAEMKDAQAATGARYKAGTTVIDELDKVSKKTKEITEQITKLKAAYQTGQDFPFNFEPEELAAMEEFPKWIEVLEGQLRRTLPALQAFRVETGEIAADVARFGVSGAVSIAAEARKLFEKGDDPNATYEGAVSAVIARRAQTTTNTAEQMRLQADAAMRLAEAHKSGAAAVLEAEIANEAYEYQLRTFGPTLDDTATAAMERYIEALRELKEAQKGVTDQQRLFNAQLELADTEAITAAIRAGASPGEIAAMRREQSLQRNLAAEGLSSYAVPGSGATRPDAITGLNTTFSYRLQQFLEAAGGGISIHSGYRSNEVQAKLFEEAVAKYGSEAAARRYVAPPGKSQHNHGLAADLTYANDAAREWAHANAGRFGLEFPMSWENWHIQPTDMRLLRSSGAALPAAGPAPEGAAIRMEAAVLDAAAIQEAAQTIANLDRQTARISATAGLSGVDRRRAEVELDARTSAGMVDPSMAGGVYDAEMRKAMAEENAIFADRMRAIDDEVKASKERLQYAKLLGQERTIEMEVLEEVAALQQQGVDIDAQRLALIREQVTARFDIRKEEENADQLRGIYENAAQGIGTALETAVKQAMQNGKIEADEILSGLLQDITMSIMNTFITQPLVNGITSWLSSAHGNAFSGGEVIPMAMGGVLSRPTMFPLARGGRGLAGEAGAEAVLPLKRGSDGRLGVSSGGGGSVQVSVYDMRSSADAEPVEIEERQDVNGQRILSIMVRDEVRRNMASGNFDAEMRGAYGIGRPTIRR